MGMVSICSFAGADTLTISRWPSIAWQIFWSWIYAPVLLWRVRDVNDVHGWRKQTVACVLAGYAFAVIITRPSLTIDQIASVTYVVDCIVCARHGKAGFLSSCPALVSPHAVGSPIERH